jgi:LPS export ABC transporter protein LptC
VTSDGSVKLEEVHYSGSKDGRVSWELDAASASLRTGEELILLEGVKLKLFSKSGTVHTLTSRGGAYNGDTGLIDVTGDVRVETNDGFSLKTEFLKYRSDKNLISSDKLVEIAASGMRVSGTGMEMEVESGSFKMLKGVRTYLSDASN